MESIQQQPASKIPVEETPRISSLETTESLTAQLDKYESSIRNIEERLADYNDLIEAAEYLSHEKDGRAIPGVKALEYDLKQAKTPAEREDILARLSNAKRNLHQASQAYEVYWESIKDRLAHLKRESKKLKDTLHIEEQRSALEKSLEALEVTEHDLEHYTIDPEEARKIIEALQAHLFESKRDVLSEVSTEASQARRKSLERYQQNPTAEIAALAPYLEEAGLSKGEVDLFYDQMMSTNYTN